MERKLVRLVLALLFAFALGSSSIALAQYPPAPDCYPGDTCAVPAAPAYAAAAVQQPKVQPQAAIELMSALAPAAAPEPAAFVAQATPYPRRVPTPAVPEQVKQEWALWPPRQIPNLNAPPATPALAAEAERVTQKVNS